MTPAEHAKQRDRVRQSLDLIPPKPSTTPDKPDAREH